MSGSPVSRGTSTPPAARALAGERIELLEDFATLLATDGITRGLLGPREVPRIWQRHLLNCAVVAPAAPEGAEVADIGSGAGLPGVVWAICRPDLRMTLVEPLLRRATFLTEVVEELPLPGVTVVRARAEELHGTRQFDVVASRAVAPLDRLSSWCLPLVRVGGRMVALKGSTAAEEMPTAAAQVQRLGGGPPSLVEHGRGVVDTPTWAVHIERVRESAPPRGGRPRRSAARR